jgi:hypothetical protein
VHVYKTAGSSVTNALMKYASNVPGWTETGGRFHHATAYRIKKKLPDEIYNTYFKFAFVRNPWDWLVADYHFVKEQIKRGIRLHPQHSLISRLSFNQFVLYKWLNPRRMNQSQFIFNKHGQLLVDFVGRFEHLQRDFLEICKTIGISVELGHYGASKHLQFREYYNARTARLVHEAYKKDIETLQYTFKDQGLISPLRSSREVIH